MYVLATVTLRRNLDIYVYELGTSRSSGHFEEIFVTLRRFHRMRIEQFAEVLESITPGSIIALVTCIRDSGGTNSSSSKWRVR